MATTTTGNRLPRLEGKANWLPWSRTAESVLEGRDLWEWVGPDEPSRLRPTKLPLESDEAFQTRQKQFRKKSGQAIEWLTTNCDSEVSYALSSYTTAAEMWDQLAALYSDKGTQFMISAVNDFLHLNFEGKAVEEWSRTFLHSLHLAEQQGIKFQPELKVLILVDRVAPYYSTWAKILNASISNKAPSEWPSLEEVIQSLINEDFGTQKEAQNALLSRPKQGRRRQCDHCHKTGHTKDYCWDLHPEKKPKQREDFNQPLSSHTGF